MALIGKRDANAFFIGPEGHRPGLAAGVRGRDDLGRGAAEVEAHDLPRPWMHGKQGAAVAAEGNKRRVDAASGGRCDVLSVARGRG